MEEIIDSSLENGYTIAWADVSEKGFETSELQFYRQIFLKRREN
ncbi:MAG: hypothetical protein R2757_12255 [Draconibacterium sp.]